MSKETTYVSFIKAVATECGYEVGRGSKSFELYTELEHPITFKVIINSEGYLQVHVWEDSHRQTKNHKYGKARYSLRTSLDVVKFCNILESSYLIRARR